jgi:hypothetical protein
MEARVSGQFKILCFDIENKPGTYGPGDYTHGKVTALGAQFLDEDEPRGWVMRRDNKLEMRRFAEEFRGMWDKSGAVMGHNIKRHDVKLLNGFFTALDLPVLDKKSMIDTYLDMPRMQGLSRSLENLCDRWGCPEPKLHLSEYDWERAYDGVPEGVEKMYQRVTSDVRINIWLFKELKRRGLL